MKPSTPLRRSPRKAVREASAASARKRLSAEEARSKIFDPDDVDEECVELLTADDEDEDDDEEVRRCILTSTSYCDYRNMSV